MRVFTRTSASANITVNQLSHCSDISINERTGNAGKLSYMSSKAPNQFTINQNLPGMQKFYKTGNAVQNSANGFSRWILKMLIVMITLCSSLDSFSQILLTENFEAATFPPTGWAVINAGSGNNWARSTATTSPVPFAGSTAHMRYIYNSSNAANSWAITQGLSCIGGTTYVVEFQQATGGFPENMKVTVGTAQTVAAQTTTMLTLNGVLNTTYIKRVATFRAPVTGNYNFGFNCFSTPDQFNLAVDEIVIRVGVDADASPVSFTQSAVTQTGMTIGWTDNSTNETVFRLYRSTDNINFSQIGADIPSTSTATTGTTYSSAQTGLLPGVTYYYKVVAAFEGESAALTGTQATNIAGAVTSTIVGGLWSAPATWAGGVVPVITDNVVIADGATVTLDITTAVANSVIVGSGSGAAAILQTDATAVAKTLTVATNFVINDNGTVRSNTVNPASATNHTLSVAGGLSINGAGTFNALATANSRLNLLFTGVGNQSFTTSATATVSLNTVTINKGTGFANVLEFIPGANFTAPATGFLAITNGTFKLSGSITKSNVVFTVAAYTIPATGSFWLNNANFTVSAQTGSPTNLGLLRITDGIFNIGTAAGNAMTGATGQYNIGGGTLNIASRLTCSGAGAYTQSGGTVNVTTVGNATTNLGGFDFTSATATINISGGIINLVQASTGTTPFDFRIANTAGPITGGTLNVGTAATATNFNFRITGSVPNLVITNATNNKTATIVTPQLVAFRDITINSGATLNFNATTGFPLFFLGTNVVNNGSIVGTAASTRFDFQGTTPQTYSGTGTWGTNAAPFVGLGVGIANVNGATLNSPIVTTRVNLFTGTFINSGQISIGGGGAVNCFVQRGGSTGNPAGSFDAAPVFNMGTGTYGLSYTTATNAVTTSFEIPASRAITSATINNVNGVTLAGGNLSMSGTLTLTLGKLTTSSSNLLTITNTAVGAIATPSATSYITGPVERTLPASLVTGSTYVFPVGKAAYNPFELVNPTTNSGGTVLVRAEAFDGNSGGTPGSLIGSINTNRYWAASLNGVTAANFINTTIRLNDAPLGADAVAASSTQAGAYNMVGGISSTVTASSILSSDATLTTSLPGFYVMGNKATPVLSGLTITPSVTQCVTTPRAVTIIAAPGAGAINTVVINYQVNGGGVQTVSMNPTANPNEWSGVIPVVTPSNGAVTWSVVATDANLLTKTLAGPAYADEPLTGILSTITPSATTVCSGSPVTLTLALSYPPSTVLAPAASTYCTSTHTSGCATDAITRVVLNTLDNSSACNPDGIGYTYYNGGGTQTTSLVVGQTYNLTLTFGSDGSQFFAAWIDYNHDGTYSASEFIGPSANAGSGGTLSLPFTVPANALGGATHIRIIGGNDSQLSSGQACNASSSGFGETEDYDITLVSLVGSITGYSWSDGSGVVSTTNPATVNPTVNPTTYTPTVTVAPGCSASFPSITINTTALPLTPQAAALSFPQCGAHVPTDAFVISNPANPTPTGRFRWYSAQTGGTLLQDVQTPLSASDHYYGIISTTTHLWVSEDNGPGTCESARADVFIDVTEPDGIQATGVTSTCAGAPLSLSVAKTGNVNGNNYTYQWTASPAAGSGMESPMTGDVLTITPTAAGSYTYTVIGTDGNCAAISTLTVTVKLSPTDVTASSNITPCTGSTIQLSSVSNTGFNSLVSLTEGFEPTLPPTWTYINAGTGGTWISDATLTVQGPHTGINAMAYLANATNAANAWAIMPGQLMTAGVTYTVSFWYKVFNAALPEKLKLTVGSANTVESQITTLWSNNGGTNLTNTTHAQAVVTFTPTVKGVYYFALNCFSDPQTGTAVFVDDVSITGGVFAPSTYSWVSNPVGYTSSEENPAAPVVVNEPTTYTVTVTNTLSCSASASVTVTPHILPTAPTGASSVQCGTRPPVEAAITSTSGASNPTFHWYSAATGGTLLQSDVATTYLSNVSTSTTFYVAEVDAVTGCESSPRTVVDVTVNVADPVTASATATTLCAGQSTTLSAVQTGTENEYVYSWSASPVPGSGMPSTVTGSTTTVTPTAAGSYTYTVTAFDGDDGCTQSSSVTVLVNPIPSAVTANASAAAVCTGGTVNLTSSALANLPVGAPTQYINEGFTSVIPLPAGWAQQNLSTPVGTVPNWVQGNDLFPPHSLPVNSYILGTFNSVAGANTISNWLFAPVVTLHNGDVFSFWTRTIDGSEFADRLQVRMSTNGASTNVGTSNISTGDFSTLLLDINPDLLGTAAGYPYDWAQYSITISGLSSPVSGRMAFRYFVENGGPDGLHSNNIGIDDVVYTVPMEAATYAWTSDVGGFTSNLQNPVNAPVNQNTNFIVTASNSAGCSASASVAVAAIPLPNPPIATNSSQCGFKVPTASVATGGSNGTFKWFSAQTGGILLQTGGTTYTTGISATQTFWVSENDGTCESLRTPVEVTVSTPDPVQASVNASTVCPNSTIILSAANTAVTPVNDYTYTWTATPVAGSGIPTDVVGSPVNVTPTTAGTYVYTVTAFDPAGPTGGCTTSSNVSVLVNPVPVIDSIKANAAVVCQGGISNLSVYSSAPATGPLTEPADYCETTYGNGTGSGDWISLVQIVGTTLNNTSVGAAAPYYTLWPEGGSTTATLNANQTYTIRVSGGTFSTCRIRAWIDFNRDGIFQATETLGVSPNVGASAQGTFTFTVPANAAAGATRIRLRSTDTSTGPGAADACDATTSSFGETEDYVITVIGLTTQNPDLNYVWTWAPSNTASGATIPVVVNANTTYTVTVTDPATTCQSTATVSVTVAPVTASVAAVPTVICAGAPVVLTGTAGGGGPFTYAWTSDDPATPGVINTSASFTVNPSMTTVYSVVVTDACGNNSTAATVTVTVNPLPTASIAETGPITICAPATQILNAQTTTGSPTYQWTLNGTNIPGANAQNYTISAASTGAYRVIVTESLTGCSTTSAAVSVTINPQPAAIVLTNVTTTICLGSVATLNGVSGSSFSNTLGVGTSTTTGNTTTSTLLGPNPMQNYYGGSKGQMLFQAAELTSIGMSAGSSISAIKLNLATADPTYVLQNLQVRMSNTASTTLTGGWEAPASMTTVRTASNYTPAVGLNTITLTTPFVWNGTGSVAVEVSYSNANGGTASTTLFNTSRISATAFVSSRFYRLDNGTAATVAAYVGTTGTAQASFSSRNDLTFDFSNTASITWAPTTGLYTNPAATTAYTGTVAQTVYAKPAVSGQSDYIATATNSFGCTNTATATVNVTALPVLSVSGYTTPTCLNSGVQTLAGTPSGGVFSGPGVSGTSFDPATAGPGDHTIVYSYTDGTTTCSNTTSILIHVNPIPIAPVISLVNNANGTSTITASGYTGTLTWSNGGSDNPHIVTASGPYSVTQTDVNGCTSNASNIVIAGPAITADPALGNMDITDLSDASQNANTLVHGQVYKLKLPVYNFEQDFAVPNGATTVTIDLGTKLVVDPAFTVATAPLSAYFSWSHAVVSGHDIITGSQIAAIPGDFDGMAVFQVISSGSCISAINANFMVDNHASVIALNDLVTNNNQARLQYGLPTTVSAVRTNVLCNAAADGTITVTASEGTTVTVNGNPYNPLATYGPGTYTIVASATNDVPPGTPCTATTSVTITEPTLMVLNATQTDVTGCYGNLNGQAAVFVTGGTPFAGPNPYTYSWNTVPVKTTPIVSGLPAGTYTVTVTDANGCIKTATVTISQPDQLLASIIAQTNVSCFGNSTGAATVSASGGTPMAGPNPYTYSWNDPAHQTGTTAVNLSAGTYIVTVSDQNGCTATASVTILEPPVLTAAATVVNDVSCNGAGDGSATVSVLGGTSPYTYLWTDAHAQTTATAVTLTPGTYSVTVTDANGCTVTTNTVTISEPPVLTIAISGSTNNTCHGGGTGSITASAAGGTTGYTYTISGPTVNTSGITSGIFTGLTAGSYTVTVTDAHSCTTTSSAVLVSEPSGTVPDIGLGADLISNFFATNGVTNTVVYNVAELLGNPAVGDTIRITKVAGYVFTFNASLTANPVGVTPLDNPRWKIDNSNPSFVSLIFDPLHNSSPGMLNCGERVYIAVDMTRNTPNLSTFTLSARLRRANGELNLNNNLFSIVFTAE